MGLTKQRLRSVLNSAQSSANNWKFHKFLLVKNYLKESLLPIFWKMVAFMNSSCVISELNWIVFMAIVKHFRVKI